MKRTHFRRTARRSGKAHRRILCCALLLATTASCVEDKVVVTALPAAPAAPAVESALDLEEATRLAETTDAQALEPTSVEAALAANAALPLSAARDEAAAPFFARAATGLDQLRSLDCLAQAIFYEARSESEAGQRAVAQVVLNRVRHPSYPASVCGVVYQGPLRAGGGCQFTFTCDGSLARMPAGPSWAAARRIAVEALSGQVYAPVGHATHYHTTKVFPHWAPRLVKAALIGSHIFYRFPGDLGAPQAFRQAYAGREPLPVPGRIVATARPRLQFASLDAPSGVPADPIVTAPHDALPTVTPTERGLPESRVREAWLNSGRPLDRAAPRQAQSPES